MRSIRPANEDRILIPSSQVKARARWREKSRCNISYTKITSSLIPKSSPWRPIPAWLIDSGTLIVSRIQLIFRAHLLSGHKVRDNEAKRGGCLGLKRREFYDMRIWEARFYDGDVRKVLYRTPDYYSSCFIPLVWIFSIVPSKMKGNTQSPLSSKGSWGKCISCEKCLWFFP